VQTISAALEVPLTKEDRARIAGEIVDRILGEGAT